MANFIEKEVDTSLILSLPDLALLAVKANPADLLGQHFARSVQPFIWLLSNHPLQTANL